MTVIPGVTTVHPRSTWNTSGYPITGPAQTPANIWRPVVHYSAAVNLPDGDLGEFQYQIGPWLSAVQKDYQRNRGYSIGYMWAVDWLGGAWELRGFDFMSAANAGHNTYTAPILFLTDRADPGTDLMWATARAIWREHRRRSGRTDFENRPWGHGELYAKTGTGTPTDCPGPPLLVQRNQGLGDLDYDNPPGSDMDILAPRRVLDTRGPDGPNRDTYKVNANTTHTIPITEAKGAKCAQVTVTVVNPEATGHLTAWRDGTRPTTSFLNYTAGQAPVTETLFVPVDANGAFRLWSHARVHVVIDFTGVIGR